MRTIRTLLAAMFLAGSLGFSLLLLSGGGLHAGTMRVTENLRGETILVPPSVPDTDRLILVSFVRIVPAEILAALAVYDDPKTRWSVDYVELYDEAGGLLSVSWVDAFCIRRTAVDRGLLEEDPVRLDGVLILVPEGTPT